MNKTRSKFLGVAAVVFFMVASTLTLAGTALADGSSINFESYSLGTVNAQDGWSSLGAAGSGCAVYDHAVANPNDFGSYPGFGTRSLRISDSVTSGCFGDQTFSKSLNNEAGEASAVSDGQSGGIRQTDYTATWQFSSTSLAEQPGMHVVASPDRGDGARMSWIQMQDTPGGLEVDFYDYQSGAENPALAAACASNNSSDDNFVYTQVATGLSRTAIHTITVNMHFVAGVKNDVVSVAVDGGTYTHTGTSWEDYYRDCELNPTRPVDSILFRTGGAADPANAGAGFLIDNLMQNSFTPSASTLVVNEANAHNWTFVQQGTCGASDTGSQGFVTGAGSPPVGTGSRELTVGSDGDSFQGFGTTGLDGAKLADLTALSYSTYVSQPSTGGGDQQAPYLVMRLDYNGDNVTDDRFFFEPTYSSGTYGGDPVAAQAPITDNTWQTWDALRGAWWSENDGFGGPPVHTLQNVAADHPDATIINGPNAGLKVSVGCGGTAWQGFIGNADNVTVGVNGVDTTYDFEHIAQCTAVCYVNDVTGNDLNGGGTAAAAKKTIQAAVSQVSPGGQVIVAAGTYSESNTAIDITKSMTISGPNAGISPNAGSRVPEAVITSLGNVSGTPAAFRISAGTTDVTFEGLKFDTPTAPMRDDSGDTITLRENIFTATGGANDGMYFEDPVLTLHDNLFTGIDTPNADTLQVGGHYPTSSHAISITDNVWNGITSSGGLNLSNVTGTITGNEFKNVEYYGILVANASGNLDISSNMFDGITNPHPEISPTWGAGIRFYEAGATTTPVTVTENTFKNSYLGVSVRAANSDITTAPISVTRNAIAGNTGGIRNDAIGTLKATCNWYGSGTGPTNAGNPGGTGDTVAGSVAFYPWLFTSNLAGSCGGFTFLGYTSPLPKTKLSASNSTIPVKFRLGDASGNPLPASFASALVTRVKLTGPTAGTTVEPCPYNTTSGVFKCNLMKPRIVTLAEPYVITTTVKIGTSYVLPVNFNGAINPESVTFKK